MTEANQHTSFLSPDPAYPAWLKALLWGMPPLVALAVGLRYGAFIIDDAYITFRYAHNLAAGKGLVFNPGDPVLGTTTPLWAVILAIFKMLGMEITQAARFLGLFSIAGLVLIVQALAARSLPLVVSSALGFCLALHPDTPFIANSGMETAFSMVLVYGGLLLILQGRYGMAGLVGGAAFLTRPDGALIVLLAAGLALGRDPKKFWQPLAASLVVVLPWLVYATVVYGWPLPHSVAAKQLIHPESPLRILYVDFRFLTLGLPMKLLFGAGLVGMILALVRRSELMLVGLWMAAYMAGLAASGIMPIFPWYLVPLFSGLILMAGYGMHELFKTLDKYFAAIEGMQKWVRLATPLLLVILASMFMGEIPAWRVLREAQFDREKAYIDIGLRLEERSQPGDVILVGEVGAIAYTLMDRVIIDSSGINSKQVYQARTEDRERLIQSGIADPLPDGSVGWVVQLTGNLKPSYIVTHRNFLHSRELANEPGIGKKYRRIMMDDPALDDYYILEKHEPR